MCCIIENGDICVKCWDSLLQFYYVNWVSGLLLLLCLHHFQLLDNASIGNEYAAVGEILFSHSAYSFLDYCRFDDGFTIILPCLNLSLIHI